MGYRIAVASSVYNLAGEISKRPDFLKSLVIGGIMQRADSLGEVIVQGYRDGPGVRLRNFLSWIKRNDEFRNTIGITKGEILVPPEVNPEDVVNHLPVVPGQTNRVDFAEIGPADFLYWAKRWVAENYPERLNEDWGAEFFEETNEIEIVWPDNTSDDDSDNPRERFTVTDYDPEKQYLYVVYTPIEEASEGPINEGEWAPLPPDQDFPAMNGWTLDYHNVIPNTGEHDNIYRTEVTYSDGRPGEIASSIVRETFEWQDVQTRYFKDDYKGINADGEAYSDRAIQHHWLRGRLVPVTTTNTITQDIGDGVIKTIKITETRAILIQDRLIKYGTQKIIHNVWRNPVIFIYPQGGGNPELDALFVEAVPLDGEFFPPIPFRYKNKPFTDIPLEWNVKLPQEFFTYDIYGNYTGIEEGDSVWVARSVDRIQDSEGKNLYLEAEILELDKNTRMAKIRHKNPHPFGNAEEIWKVPQDKWLYNVLSEKESAPVFADKVTRGILDPPDWTPTWYEVPQTPTANPRSQDEIAKHDLFEKAFKKAFNAKYDDVMKAINNNENIGDIDYCYAVFGVPLNVEEEAGRRYIYKFFQKLKQQYNLSPEAEAAWWNKWHAADKSHRDYQAWWKNQARSSSYVRRDEPIPYPSIPWRSISVESKRPGISDYRTKITWAFITEETGNGILKEGVKVDECWIEVLDDPIDLTWVSGSFRDFDSIKQLNNRIRICWQDSRDTWRRLTITGLSFNNYIYKNKSEYITAKEALKYQDSTHPDYEESGFIVPLHEIIFNELKMVDRTQLATACCLLVFNCYVKKKKKWYESGWFKVLAFILVIVISVAVTIVTGGAGIGLLGSAASVGGALGATGTTAIIIGAAANALAGVVVGAIITQAATAIFGDEVGAIVGTILAAAITVGAMSPDGLMGAFDVLTSPPGLMSLSLATGDGIATWMKAEAQNIAEITQKMMEKANRRLAALQKKYAEEFGTGHRIDLEWISQYISELTERPEGFLSRTLMTGSDIVELTLAAISDFPELSLQLSLP